jgi:nitrogen fixation protein NifX
VRELGREVRIAIATVDAKALNAHFNQAFEFVVYDVTSKTSRFVELVLFHERPRRKGDDARENEELVAGRLAVLDGCDLLFALTFSHSARVLARRAGLHPVIISSPKPITTIIASLQSLLGDHGPT